MRPTRRVAARLALTLAVSAPALLLRARDAETQSVAAAPPVSTQFRVFNGTEEVTPRTRLRVTPSGSRGSALDLNGPSAELAPAMYDVQALHKGDGGVVAIKRVERLAVMHYPDEGGQHLEVINLQPGFGALQLRATRGALEAEAVTIYRAGDPTSPAGRAIAGGDYVLFVVPAGRYDVRIDHAEHDGSSDTHWLTDVEVPADRTRLKLVDPSGS